MHLSDNILSLLNATEQLQQREIFLNFKDEVEIQMKWGITEVSKTAHVQLRRFQSTGCLMIICVRFDDYRTLFFIHIFLKLDLHIFK